MKRREWMALCARGTGGFLLGACIAPPRQEVDLPDVGDDSETTALPPDYLFGTYEVREDAATAWLSATAACVASFELWTAGAAEPAEVGEVILTAERGYASAYQFEGLEPDKEYRYRVIFDDT